MKSFAERLWDKIAVRGPDDCWLWLSGKNSTGYGRLIDNGKRRFAHRSVYEIEIGPLLPGMCALHRCDTPACCNPRHLFSGTQRQNMADMAAKGRSKSEAKRGERIWTSKFTEQQVRDIRRSTEKGIVLARRYGVNSGTISRIMSRKSWNHLTEGDDRPSTDNAELSQQRKYCD